MQKGQTLIYLLIGILVLALVGGGAYYLGTRNKTLEERLSEQNPNIFPSPGTQSGKPTPGTKPNLEDETAKECGSCGPKGLHNIYGKQCAKGLQCKNTADDVVSSVYFCVKPEGSIKDCLER